MSWSGINTVVSNKNTMDESSESDSGGEEKSNFMSGSYQNVNSSQISVQMNSVNSELASLSTNNFESAAPSSSNNAHSPFSFCESMLLPGPSSSRSVKHSSMLSIIPSKLQSNNSTCNSKLCKALAGTSNSVPFNFNGPATFSRANDSNIKVIDTPPPRKMEASCEISSMNSSNDELSEKIQSTAEPIPLQPERPHTPVLVNENKNLNKEEHDLMEVCHNMPSTENQLQNIGPLYNWQSTMTTVKERFAFLFNNEILSDVHFLVGKGETIQRIPSHKFVLSVGSAVFDAMFNGRLGSQQEEINLPDVEPQAFLSLLRFLYSDEVQIGPETVMTVLYTAKKYAVPALERHCVEFLKCNLSPDNAFMLLTQACLFDETQLAALCLDTIDKNTTESLLADGFTEIDHATLCLVLERDTLRIREAKLFQAVVRWSEQECERRALPITPENHRKLLDGALYLIRFPLMTVEEFAQGPAQSSILTDKEVVELFLHFHVNPKPKLKFLDIPRCCMTCKEQTVCRFQHIESRWGYSGTSDRIRFIVDRRIFVAGFGMYGSIHGPAEYEVTIQVIHTATGKVCASNDTSFVSDGTFKTFRVMFKEPVEVLPNTNYTAYATLKGPDSHYGTKGVRKVSLECPAGERVTFQFTYAAGNNNGTSVEDGQIPEIVFYT